MEIKYVYTGMVKVTKIVSIEAENESKNNNLSTEKKENGGD